MKTNMKQFVEGAAVGALLVSAVPFFMAGVAAAVVVEGTKSGYGQTRDLVHNHQVKQAAAKAKVETAEPEAQEA